MNLLVVYASQFGNTEHLAKTIGSALEPRHTVRVIAAKDARDLTGEGVDLLLVGAPTQMFGRRRLVRSFLDGLTRHGFSAVAAAAFDTRMGHPDPEERRRGRGHRRAPGGGRLPGRRTARELPGGRLHRSAGRG